jgi:acetolactate decarboxylase
MLSRRGLIHQVFVSSCTACAGLALGSRYRAVAIDLAQHNEIDGLGYKLWFIGGMRDAIMNGRREATLDLRTLKNQPHLYGVGPIEGLSGEATIADSRPSLARVGSDKRAHVTEDFEAGVPFFVWAQVAAWRDVAIPDQVRSYADLELFVGTAGKEAGLTQAFPFVVTGRPDLIDYHIVDAKSDTPVGMAAHQKIQIPFEMHDQEATLVGFWSDKHYGIFTPMGSNIHIHFQSTDNSASGHVQGLKLGEGSKTLRIPQQA